MMRGNGERAVATAALVLSMIAAIAEGKGKEQTFPYPAERVYAAALAAVAKEYRIESTDAPSRTIAFRTGMSMSSTEGQDGSLIVIPVSDAECKVVVNTEKRGRQIIAWGEGGKLQAKVLKLIAEELDPKKKGGR